MVKFPVRKLQVFISSTFIDLRVERQAAVEAVLQCGHIPAGMELFTAGDESQMQVIKQWIDESDVYMLILGGRYGSIEPTSQLSYTELEFRYAIDKGKALFALVMSEKLLDLKVSKVGKEVLELSEPQKFEDFKKLVKTKTVGFFEDIKDIKLEVQKSLADFARREELRGWIRTPEQNVGEIADELARLSSENGKLRAQIDENGNSLLHYVELLEKDTDWMASFLHRADPNNYPKERGGNTHRQLATLGLFDLEGSYYRLSSLGKEVFAYMLRSGHPVTNSFRPQ